MTPLPHQTRGAIAAPHHAAAEAGRAQLRRGGNAVDAALAASFVLSVSYPHNTSIGGDVIALLRSPDGSVSCINASGPAAAATDPTALRTRHRSTMPLYGSETITVPGSLAGLEALHIAAGSRPWAELISHAQGLAVEGVEVSRSLAKALAAYFPDYIEDPGMSAVFAPQGRPLQQGEMLRQPALGETLAQLAAEGAPVFYRGALGEGFIRGVQQQGSPLETADLANFAVEHTPALSHTDSLTVHTSGLNTQGFLLPQVLQASTYLNDGQDAGALATLWAQAHEDRDRLLADPRLAGVSEQAVLARSYAEQMALKTEQRKPEGTLQSFPQPKGDTVAITAVDELGYAVCLVQSVFHPLGSRVLDPTTGILAHNRGAFFSLDPENPNVIAGGKRPGHTLVPVIVTEGQEVKWVLGTMGGKAQPQVHFHVLNALRAGLSPEAAVTAPRWIIGGLGADHPEDAVFCESDVEDSVQSSLRARGFDLTIVEPHSEMLGHANVVGSGPAGFTAASDPRSDGAGLTV